MHARTDCSGWQPFNDPWHPSATIMLPINDRVHSASCAELLAKIAPHLCWRDNSLTWGKQACPAPNRGGIERDGLFVRL